MDIEYGRRDFLKLGATVGAGLAFGGIISGCSQQLRGKPPILQAAPIETIRIGFVGVGHRGTNLLKLLLLMEGVDLCSTVKSSCPFFPLFPNMFSCGSPNFS